MSLLFEHVNFIFCSVYKVVNESESSKKSSYLTPIWRISIQESDISTLSD